MTDSTTAPSETKPDTGGGLGEALCGGLGVSPGWGCLNMADSAKGLTETVPGGACLLTM